MKILNNKKYQELFDYKQKYINLLEENKYLRESNIKNDEILDRTYKELIDLKSQVVGNISNTKIKSKIDKIIKNIGGK